MQENTIMKILIVTLVFFARLGPSVQQNFHWGWVDEIWGDTRKASFRNRTASRADLQRYRYTGLDVKADDLYELQELLKKGNAWQVKDDAPKTWARAYHLAGLAEQKLKEAGYNIAEFDSLARLAKHEAQHALYLAEKIKKLKAANASFEDILLSEEQPLKQIADMMKMETSGEIYGDRTCREIISQIAAYQDSLRALSRDLENREIEIGTMKGRIAGLEIRLAGEKAKAARRQSLQSRAYLMPVLSPP